MSQENLPTSICDLPTPCFLVDLPKAKLNASRMLERCKDFGVHFRPHMKTHKTIELAILQTGGTKRRIVVSTIQEAQFYADSGFDDILYAIPITADKIPRCEKLANTCDLHLMFDSQDGIEALEKAPLKSGKKWSVFLSVDTGFNREGSLWNSEDIIQLAKQVVKMDAIQFQGIYTFDGHSYDSKNEDDIRKVGAETVDKITNLKNRLQKEGINCTTVSFGSTPSCTKLSKITSTVTEFHAGTYIFFDYEEVKCGACSVDEIACRVATRVVSHCPSDGHMLVDCGFTAIGHDGIDFQHSLPSGFSTFQNNPNLRLVKVCQELGLVKAADGKLDFKMYPIGTLLYLYPCHSCATAAMHPVYYAHDGDKVVGIYKPTRGW